LSKGEVLDASKRMAVVVDQENEGAPLYEAMAPDFTCIAFTPAIDLVLKGAEQPSGYTEPLLHKGRLAKKLA